MKGIKHPKELWPLSIAALTVRFAFWGIGNLLVLYLVGYYHFSVAKAAHAYGILTALSAFLPLIGGYLSDKWNYHTPPIIAIVLSALGCFLMAIQNESLMYVSIALLCCGFGLFVPSLFAIINNVYKKKKEIKEAGFSIFYTAFNLGAFLAFISIGYVSYAIGWTEAFILAGIVQLLGIFPLLFYLKIFHPKHAHIKKKEEEGKINEPMTKVAKGKLAVIGIFSFITIFYWSAYYQGWSSFSIFALKFTNKIIFGYTIPTAWILSLESFFILLVSPILIKIYQYLEKRHKNPQPTIKLSLGLLFISFAFVVITIGAIGITSTTQIANKSIWFLAITYFFIAISEMLLAPISLSSITHLSPKKYIALMIGVWYVCCGIAGYIGGLLAGLIQKFHSTSFFFSIFIWITLIPAIFLIIFSKKINKMMNKKEKFE